MLSPTKKIKKYFLKTKKVWSSYIRSDKQREMFSQVGWSRRTCTFERLPSFKCRSKKKVYWFSYGLVMVNISAHTIVIPHAKKKVLITREQHFSGKPFYDDDPYLFIIIIIIHLKPVKPSFWSNLISCLHGKNWTSVNIIVYLNCWVCTMKNRVIS